MIAYKFLSAGAVGPFSRFAWTAPAAEGPGGWVEASGPLSLCSNGVHAVRPAALPCWIDEELWAVQLDGDVLEEEGIVVARRGRLVSKVEGWNRVVALEFARACARRAAERARAEPGNEHLVAYARDAADEVQAAVSAQGVATTAYIAAHAAQAGDPDGFGAERAWQATWLVERLRLTNAAEA